MSNGNTARASERWAVVGGGILGMRLAEGLRERGAEVTIFEAAPQLGGLADAWQVGEVTWDRHYHVTLYSDLRLRSLLQRIGLASELEWGQTKTGFFVAGKFYSMSTSLEFLKFPPLSLWQKARLGTTILRASRIRDAESLHKTRVHDWLRKWSGKKVCERIWFPLLRSKLGEHHGEASAAFIWATIQRMYAARNSGLKVEKFGYVKGGYRVVLDAYASKLAEAGVQVECQTPVERIEKRDGKVQVTTAMGAQPFDRVASTLVPPLVEKVCTDLSDAERQRLLATEYLGIVCTSLVLKRPLKGYYVTNITDEGYPFTGVIEMSSLVSPGELAGRHLVYLPQYLPSDSDEFSLSDDEIFTKQFAGLKRMIPDLVAEDVEAYGISRARHVFPFPSLGYSEKVVGPQTSVPGLDLVNSSQIVGGTLNVNETIEVAERYLADLECGANA